MANDITALDAKLKSYLSANRDELISQALFNSKATSLFSLMTGVKNPQAIIRVDVNAPLQDGSACGFTADGDDEYTNRVITPVAVAVQKEWCPKDFLQSYKAQDIAIAAGRETMPYEEKILTLLSEKIADNIENLVLSGDTNNGDLMDGFATLVAADITNSVIPAGNVVAKGSDDVLTRCQKLWAACSADLGRRESTEIWLPIGMYKTLHTELANANAFHIWKEYEGEYLMTMPAVPGLKIRGVSGLSDSADVIYLFDTKEVFYAVDLENQTEVFDFWFSQDNQTFRFNCQMMVGLNYAIPENIYVNQ